MEKYFSLLLSICFVSIAPCLLCQIPPVISRYCDASRVMHFTAGVQFPAEKKMSLGVFKDSLNQSLLTIPDKDRNFLLLTLPKEISVDDDPFLILSRDSSGQVSFQAKGEAQNQISSVSIYDGGKLKCSRAVLLGAPVVPAKIAKKVTWIDLFSLLGRPMDFNGFPQLNTFQLQKLPYSYIAIHHKEYNGDGFENEYMGDPFLMKQLFQIPTIKNIILQPEVGYFYPMHSDNLYFLDGPPEIWNFSELSSFVYDAPVFLPVQYGQYKYLQYLSVGGIVYPELVQLCLVLKNNGLDTVNGNWGEFLSLADDSKTFVIPQNGSIETFYKNEKPLCKGSYKNGKPDNEWQFWYEDGALCQQRTYSEGKRIGSWFFLNPEGDTLTKLHYENDFLLYRKDLSPGSIKYSPTDCYNQEFMVNVIQVSESQLVWQTPENVTINKKISFLSEQMKSSLQKDTLRGFHEKWIFTDSGWEYSKSDFCGVGNTSEAYYYKGATGRLPYLLSHTRFYERNGQQLESNWLVNITECFWEQRFYSDANPEKEMRLIYSKHDLDQEEINCIKKQ